MKDTMLGRFCCDNELHEKAIAHAKDKGMGLGRLNIFMQPQAWELLTEQIAEDKYETQPTEIHYIDKNNGNPLTYEQAVARNFEKVREIYVMNQLDRVVWNMFYQICYERFEHMISKHCVSYKRGVSTGKVAKELSGRLVRMGAYKGTKDDLSKFFDSVPINVIDELLDKLEEMEPSAIWKPIRSFYHDNRVIINGEHVERFGSLKQGCAFACLLADLVLAHVDEEIAAMDVIYYRYSDDVLILGKEAVKARWLLGRRLEELGLAINPAKSEYITEKKWFNFLGWKFRGGDVSIGSKTLKNLQHNIKVRTLSVIKKQGHGASKAQIRQMIKDLQWYFFTAYAKSRENFGMGVYLFGAINVEHDLREIEYYIRDCLRACYTDKWNIYSLGESWGKYAVTHGIGQNVAMNYTKTHNNSFEDGDLLRECGWISLLAMWKSYKNGKALFASEINKMLMTA